MQAELERRDDAEVPAAAAERPEEIVVLCLARDERLPVGRDDLGREEVVAREAEAPRQVANAAAQREPADAGRGDDATGRRETVGARRVVEHAPRGASLGARRLRFGIDLNVRHAGQVDHDRVVGSAEAGDAVATPAHGEVELVLAGEAHSRDHVVGGRAADDDTGPPVDHGVEDLARLLVSRVARRDHLTADALAEPFDRLGAHRTHSFRVGVRPVA